MGTKQMIVLSQAGGNRPPLPSLSKDICERLVSDGALHFITILFLLDTFCQPRYRNAQGTGPLAGIARPVVVLSPIVNRLVPPPAALVAACITTE